MAESFVTLGSFPTVQVESPTSVIDILRVTFRTIPSGVVAYANIPSKKIAGAPSGSVDDLARVFIGPVAEGIERMMGLGVISSATGIEDTDASGLTVDYIEAIVTYEPSNVNQPGSFQTTVRIPVFAFGEDILFNKLVRDPIMGAYAKMQALAEA